MSDKNETQLPTEGGSTPRPCSARGRYVALRAREIYHRLANHPHLRAEAIADHYSKLAAMSMQLRELVNLRRRQLGSVEMDRCIDLLTQEIADHHLADFGIELSWQNASVVAAAGNGPKSN